MEQACQLLRAKALEACRRTASGKPPPATSTAPLSDVPGRRSASAGFRGGSFCGATVAPHSGDTASANAPAVASGGADGASAANAGADAAATITHALPSAGDAAASGAPPAPSGAPHVPAPAPWVSEVDVELKACLARAGAACELMRAPMSSLRQYPLSK
eukprot:355936-Chlamydomonas_euryale.AAC.2